MWKKYETNIFFYYQLFKMRNRKRVAKLQFVTIKTFIIELGWKSWGHETKMVKGLMDKNKMTMSLNGKQFGN